MLDLLQPLQPLQLPQPCTSRRFQINRPAFKLSYDIVAEDGSSPLYHVKNGVHTSKAPALAFHNGPSEAAPVIAVCHMPHFSLGYKIGFGDPTNNTDTVQWEDMIKTKFNNSEHRFSFVWKRTRHVCVAGKTVRKASPRNWKLLDEDNTILAIFNDDRKIGICGVLQIEQDHGQDFDVMVMITLMALYERSRRA
ncbi:hypothetical protein PT974_01441 [Cladobotryum mycophilum]|uniref:Uncharacterized protein n=1 Tax=Cladobotryum mycophilum TaxID=491253 RepID=A0ABR0T3Z0_9HYPO